MKKKRKKKEIKWTVKAILTKGPTKYFINKFSVLNGAKYFSGEVSQNCLVFILSKKYIKAFSVTTNNWFVEM